jgi:Xaa-Pro aminopeptidase
MASAGELVSTGVDLALERARPGLSERELANEIETALRDGGAESLDYILVASGPATAAAHHQAGARRLSAGEPVLFDIAVRVDGYFADITQQVFLGAPPIEYVRAYDAVKAAQEAGVAAAVVGATPEDVDRAAGRQLVAAGFERETRTGHGLGLDVHEAPSVVEGNHLRLEPGIALTVEPGIYLPGRWGIRIEDTVLVTQEGPKRLTRGARPLSIKR